jgi:hypothetical protein
MLIVDEGRRKKECLAATWSALQLGFIYRGNNNRKCTNTYLRLPQLGGTWPPRLGESQMRQ